MREGCEVHRGDLRVPRRGAQGDGAAARTSSTWPRSSAGSRTSTSSRTRSPRSTTRLYNARLPRGAGRATSSASSTSLELDGLRARRAVPDAARTTSTTARCRCRRTGSPSSPARSTAAPPTTSTGCRTRSAARSTPTGRARCPTTSPGIAHAVPDLIRKSLARMRPLPIFGSGEQTRTLTHVDDIADGIVTAMAHPAGPQRGLQHLRRPRADGRRDRPHLLGGVRQRPRRASSSSTCRASRSTSCAAGRRSRRPSGCSAGGRRSASRRAIAQTAEWLRALELPAAT